MKIVFISHGSTLEGAERCLIEAIKGLSLKEVEIHVILPYEGKLFDVLKEMEISVYIRPNPWWINEYKNELNPVKRYLRPILSIAKILYQIQPNLVVTNTIVAPSGAIAAKLLHIPHIWYIHEFLEEDHGLSFEFSRKVSLRLINWLSRNVIVNSKAVEKRFNSEISLSKLKLIYYAVENSAISNRLTLDRNNKCFRVALLGRKAFSKGQEDAIRALSILISKKLNIILWLVGGGSDEYTDYLQRLAKDLDVDHQVEFISFVDNPSDYMISADVVLMCSRCEAFGRVTIEAMKLGKAVIGSNSGATPELIKDGWNGITYEVNNANSLAEKIELLYYDESLRKQLEINAYNWANKHFNLDKYTFELLNLFRQTI